MRILPITVVLLLLPAVLSTQTTKTAYSNAIQDTMNALERHLPKTTTPASELPTAERQAAPCIRFTIRRVISCLCEITRVQFVQRTIPREPGRQIIRNCASVLGVGRRRFGGICTRMGFDISGDPRTSIIGLRTMIFTCGPGASLAGLNGMTM